jgi:predicted transposase YdaD
MEKLINESNDIINKAYNTLSAHNWTEQELRQYEAVKKITMDALARESYVRDEAREEGLKEGIEKGLKEGVEKGLKEGREEGIKEGIKQGKIELAKKMLAEGMSLQTVSKLVGLNEEEFK